jgi:hypothetical protein
MQLFSLYLLASAPAVARGAEGDARRAADSVKQQITEADHHIDEAGCTAGKAECGRRKAHDHMEEAKERVSDKITEGAADLRKGTK